MKARHVRMTLRLEMKGLSGPTTLSGLLHGGAFPKTCDPWAVYSTKSFETQIAGAAYFCL